MQLYESWIFEILQFNLGIYHQGVHFLNYEIYPSTKIAFFGNSSRISPEKKPSSAEKTIFTKNEKYEQK